MERAQGPAIPSRRTFDAPVNAPKKRLPVSTAIGADRTIVGVPTLPTRPSPALAPRSSADVPAGGSPATTGVVVVGHFAGAVDFATSSRSRVAASAACGWY